MPGAGSFVVKKFKHMLPPTVFFVVCFNVIVLTLSLLSDGAWASAGIHATATLGGLVCGKAVLIADKLPFFNRYPEKPLIWNTAWKTALYLIVTLCFRLLEKLVAAATNDYGFSAGLEDEAAHFEWTRFWAIQLWLAILFFAYSGFGEFVRAVGRERVIQMFLGPIDRPARLQEGTQ